MEQINLLKYSQAAEIVAPVQPCVPSPCGSNAECRVQNNIATCSCITEYIGNPYEGCRPECTINSDCPANLACIRSKCQNPCLGLCPGRNSYCQVVSHLPICSCLPGTTGDPFVSCAYQIEDSKSINTVKYNLKKWRN